MSRTYKQETSVFFLLSFCFLLCMVPVHAQHVDELRACQSKIFCNDAVLKVFQLAGIFNDSKTFVDMPLKASEDDVLEAFNALPDSPTIDQLKDFLNTWFEPAGSDLQVWIPDDWSENPPQLQKIVDQKLVDWAKGLNDVWIELGRQATQSVLDFPDRHSLMPTKNGFIVAGGRFREFYYWDTYWIVNGLLACDMPTTVAYTLDNFKYLLETYGKIPNGARVYYEERSQPPVLIQLVDSYYKYLNKSDPQSAIEFLESYIPTLWIEYNYWMDSQAVTVTGAEGEQYSLNYYNVNSNVPRPEGYAEDIETAAEAGIADPFLPSSLYKDIAAAAASGWDFSSRWFADHKNMETIRTTDILPIDLNSIMYKNEIAMYKFYSYLNQNKPSSNYSDHMQYFKNAAQQRKNAIEEFFWNDETGIWVDYNFAAGAQQPADIYYASAVTPLWAELYWDNITTGSYSPDYITSKVIDAITAYDVLNYPGGLPTSLIDNGQQWDFPNAWAPLQLFAIQGFQVLGSTGQQWAANLASKWLESNYNGWTTYQAMFEKYNVSTNTGAPGNGGEYDVQTGFGWTNGAVLELLLTYCTEESCFNSEGGIQVPVLKSNVQSNTVESDPNQLTFNVDAVDFEIESTVLNVQQGIEFDEMFPVVWNALS